MELNTLEKLPLKGYFNASWITNLTIIIFSLLIQKRIPPQIPIFYGLPQGEVQLSSPIGILIPSVSSLIFILLNLSLINVIKDEFIKKILVVAGLTTAIFASITVVKIIFLVGQI
ncbi:hypothetical protein COX03_01260 [Candidatus Woesebacteria bacterium CG22_combo_CG10-13_8_21_14_all_39_10]|uniref:DUF1648 domain-containing protein n=3 Tax=Candidatus Woeseibacteriota TaxID=1752722 RepID=A0A2M7X8V7_9BACT|nr:MAG: hypothetical protein COX03_01260 [Candidatus Woesebacteria bacterium CG22_combo_CG10-13_8_21_14_all_39_10]PIZ50239.1 MAG: hypothetical protein COY29_00215 [Candidatus Woesebacteria bacterium CG_4_10_14_0_2_um_filter_39_14]PJA42600.1 MAG: hypothetical protein CO176_02245 [Candidatus Woesebacteria bacterium CG_4_9_14_3_um_filter_39_10]